MCLIFCSYRVSWHCSVSRWRESYLRRGKLAEAVWRWVHTPPPRPSCHNMTQSRCCDEKSWSLWQRMIRSGSVEPGSSLVQSSPHGGNPRLKNLRVQIILSSPQTCWIPLRAADCASGFSSYLLTGEIMLLLRRPAHINRSCIHWFRVSWVPPDRPRESEAPGGV